MINFIICEDNQGYRHKIASIITSYMMKNDFEYHIHEFDDYNQNIINMVNNNESFKVYILDIELPNGSGVDIARMIRKEDVDSVIIFLTGHQELSDSVSKNQLSFLTFINKFDNTDIKLSLAIDKALQMLKVRKMLRVKDCGTIYTIALDDILYIVKESMERKCIIKTDYAEFTLNKSLNEITKSLNPSFIKTHRACVVNRKRVVRFNKNKKIIMFDTGEQIDLVSTRFEGEFI